MTFQEFLPHAPKTGPLPDFMLHRLASYEEAKKFVFCQMVNKERHRDSLKERPYEDWQDLAITYYCELGDDRSFGAAARMTYALLDQLGVPEETLRADAWKNTLEREAVIQPLSCVLEAMGGPGYGESPLYLLSNREMVNGAIAAAYPGTCQKAGALFGRNYFLIPSSIHEFLLLPDDGDMDARMLDQMIAAINESHVRPQEVLADHAYYYDGRTRTVSLASRYQKRRNGGDEAQDRTDAGAGDDAGNRCRTPEMML